jgi:hypothetical protein
MATSIGQLHVVLGANIAKFNKGFKRAGTSVSKFARRVGRTTATLAKYGTIAAAAAAAVGGVLVKRTTNAMAQMGRFAKSTGVSVHALTRLQYAAEQTGVEFEDVVGLIEESNIRLGEAIQDGTGPAVEALRKLGLSASDLANMPIEERLGAIGDALNGVQNTSERQFLADEIFGGDAFKVMSLLRQGEDGMRRLGAAAEALGATYGEDAAGGAAQFNQSLGQLKTVFEGALRSLTTKIAPALKSVTDIIVKWGPSIGGMFSGLMGRIRDMVSPIIDWFTENWDAAVDGMAKHFVAVQGVIGAVWNAIMKIADAVLSWFGVKAQDSVGGVMDVFSWLQRGIVTVLNAIEFGIENWELVLNKAMVDAALGIVKFWGQMKWVFVDVIPAVLKWFGENWQDIFTDVFNWTFTVFKNLASNIVNIVSNIPGLISGQVSLSELWTPLTEGFESAIKEMPDIPDRVAGDLEQALASESDMLGDKLGREWDKFIAGKEAEAQKLVDAFQPADGNNDALNAAVDKHEKIAATIGDTQMDQSRSELKLLRAGSAEAQRFQYRQGRGVDAVAEISKEQLSETKRSNSLLGGVIDAIRETAEPILVGIS